MSVAKGSPHVPLKCGYVCLYCRECNIVVDRILASPCGSNAQGHHAIVKKAVQCLNCNALGDCTNEFMKQECLGKNSVGTDPSYHGSFKNPEPPTPPSIARPTEVPARPAVATPASEAGATELVEAKQRLEKLRILKELEVERVKLQELLVRKNGIESTWAAL